MNINITTGFLCFFSTLLVSQVGLAQPKEQPVSSKIAAVTVFTKGAQIGRKAKASLAVGKTDLVFTGLSPRTDPQSVQVKATGNFTILSVVYRLNSVTDNKRTAAVETLESQRKALLQKITTERKLLDVFKNEEKILRDNQAVGTSEVPVKTADLRELADFQRTRLTEVLLKQVEIENRIQGVDSAVVRLNQSLQNVTTPREIPSGEVVVSVLAKAADNAQFDLTYLVNDARWFPTYDVRVKDINSPIDLTFKASVSQQSGEDWRDVKLTISTGNPKENSVAPTLRPWSLGFGYPVAVAFDAGIDGAVSGRVTDKSGAGLPAVSVSAVGTSLGTNTDSQGNYALLVPAGANRLAFSAIGFTTQEVTLTSNRINVALAEDTRALNEVVVTSYDSRQRNNKAMPPRDDLPAHQRLPYAPQRTTESFQPTTLSYDIDEPYTVLTDGKVYVADIKTYSVPAGYDYVAVPKLEPDAFLTARVANWKDLNLLEAEARLFFEGAYLGKTLLDVRNAGDTLSLSLGRDKGIVVERKRLPDFSAGRFLSNNKVR